MQRICVRRPADWAGGGVRRVERVLGARLCAYLDEEEAAGSQSRLNRSDALCPLIMALNTVSAWTRVARVVLFFTAYETASQLTFAVL